MKTPTKRHLSHPEDDVIDATVDFLRERLPQLDEDTLDELEVALRLVFGGQQFYVRRRPMLAKAAALGAALRRGLPLHQAIASAGVSRATAYRVLGLRRSR